LGLQKASSRPALLRSILRPERDRTEERREGLGTPGRPAGGEERTDNFLKDNHTEEKKTKNLERHQIGPEKSLSGGMRKRKQEGNPKKGNLSHGFASKKGKDFRGVANGKRRGKIMKHKSEL